MTEEEQFKIDFEYVCSKDPYYKGKYEKNLLRSPELAKNHLIWEAKYYRESPNAGFAPEIPLSEFEDDFK